MCDYIFLSLLYYGPLPLLLTFLQCVRSSLAARPLFWAVSRTRCTSGNTSVIPSLHTSEIIRVAQVSGPFGKIVKRKEIPLLKNLLMHQSDFTINFFFYFSFQSVFFPKIAFRYGTHTYYMISMVEK